MLDGMIIFFLDVFVFCITFILFIFIKYYNKFIKMYCL